MYVWFIFVMKFVPIYFSEVLRYFIVEEKEIFSCISDDWINFTGIVFFKGIDDV